MSGWGWDSQQRHDGSMTNPHSHHQPNPLPPILHAHPYFQTQQPPLPPPPAAYGSNASTSNTAGWNSSQYTANPAEAYPRYYPMTGNVQPSHLSRNPPSVATRTSSTGYREPIPPPPPPLHLNPYQPQPQQFRQNEPKYEHSQQQQVQLPPQQPNIQDSKSFVAKPPPLPTNVSRPALTKDDDSSMDMSVEEPAPNTSSSQQKPKSTKGDTSVQKELPPEVNPLLDARVRSYRAKHGDQKTNQNYRLKTLAMLAHCYDMKQWPTDQHIYHDFIRKSNKRVSQDTRNPNVRMVDTFLQANGLLEMDANGYRWIHTKIETVLAAIASESVDLDGLLPEDTRPNQSRNGPAQRGGGGYGDTKTILDLLQFFEEKNAWPKTTDKLANILKTNVRFLLLPRSSKMKNQRNKVETILKQRKFLEIAGPHFVWKFGPINEALRKAGRKPIEIPSKTKTETQAKGLNVRDNILHEKVVSLFHSFRANGESWPLRVCDLDPFIAKSTIMTFAGGIGVEAARKDIIRRIFVPNDYVAWNDLAAGDVSGAVITWQMDNINAAFSRWQYPTFDELTASSTFSGLHKKVLDSFCSCHAQLRWPGQFSALKPILERHGIFDMVSDQDLLCRILLPNGYMSISEGDRVSYHYRRIHLAIGRSRGISEPFQGRRDGLLDDKAKATKTPYRHKSVAAAQACHSIFSIVGFWPKHRAEMTDFLELNVDSSITAFVSIPPHYEVAEKVQDILEPLFCEAKLLVVDSQDQFRYTWSDQPDKKVETNPEISPAGRVHTNDAAGVPAAQSSTVNDTSVESNATAGTDRMQNNTKGVSFVRTSTKRPRESSPTELSKKQKSIHEAQRPIIQRAIDSEQQKSIHSKAKDAKLKLARAEIKRDYAKAKKNLEHAQTQMLQRATVIQPVQTPIAPPAYVRGLGLRPLACENKRLFINLDGDDSGDVHFADLMSIDDILHHEFIPREYTMEVKPEPQIDVKPEPQIGVKPEPQMEGVAGETQKASAPRRYPNEFKAGLIERLKRLLHEHQKRLGEETKTSESFAKQLAECTASLKSTSTEILAYDHRIPEMESDIAVMQDLVAEKLLDITRKRQALQKM